MSTAYITKLNRYYNVFKSRRIGFASEQKQQQVIGQPLFDFVSIGVYNSISYSIVVNKAILVCEGCSLN